MSRINPWICVGLLTLFAGAAAGQDDFGAPEDRKGSPSERPDMPTVEEAEKITRGQIVVHYPRIVPIIQYGWGGAPSDAIEESFNGVIEAAGLDPSDSFSGNFQHVDFALRVDINYRWRVAAECVVGRNNGDAVEDFRRYGVMVTRALTSEETRGVCLSAGAGICMSQIGFQRDYQLNIPDTNDYLTGISWRSDWTAVIPVQLMLEIPNLRYSRGGLVVTAAYQFGPTESGTMEVDFEDQSTELPMELSLSVWMLSVGLAMGF